MKFRSSFLPTKPTVGAFKFMALTKEFVNDFFSLFSGGSRAEGDYQKIIGHHLKASFSPLKAA